MLKKSLCCCLLLIGLLAFSGAAHVGNARTGRVTTSPAAVDACKAIQGKTYVGFFEGSFDTLPNYGFGVRWVFDSQAKGTGLALYIGDTSISDTSKTTPAEAQPLTATCGSNPDGTGTLSFNGGSAGSSTFWVFDNGARLWVIHNYCGRQLPGWLLVLPQTFDPTRLSPPWPDPCNPKASPKSPATS